MPIRDSQRNAPAAMDQGGSRRKNTRVKPLIFAALLVLCTAVAYLPPVRQHISLENVNEQIDHFRQIANSPAGPLVFILASIAVILAQMPGLIMVVLGGLVYDFKSAYLYSLVASWIGTTMTFLISRFFLREYFRPRLVRSFLRRYVNRMEQNGVMTVFFFRLVMALAPQINWLLGATDIKIRHYALGNALGLAPMLLAVLIAVRQLKTVRSAGDLLRPETLLILGGFVLAVSLILWARHRFVRTPQSNDDGPETPKA